MPVVKALFDDNCLQGYAAAMLVGIIFPFAIYQC